MNTPNNQHRTVDLLTIKASTALATVLRAKRQQVAPLIIRHEDDLLTFNPLNWIRYARRRATGEDAQFAAFSGQYLAPVFQNVTGWSADHYRAHLKQLAATLNESLVPSDHQPSHITDKLIDLWNMIPNAIKDDLVVDAMTANLHPTLDDKP